MGIALAGSAMEKKINYELAMYSGGGYTKLDTDMLKALCANININAFDGLNIIMTYYNKEGINSSDSGAGKFIFSEILLTYKYGSLLESYLAAIEVLGPASAGKSGVKQIVSAHAGYKITDWVSVFSRIDVENPDTFAGNDETNQYYAGLLFPVAEKAVFMMNYSLKQKRIQGPLDYNENIFVAQVKWDW